MYFIEWENRRMVKSNDFRDDEMAGSNARFFPGEVVQI